MDLHLSPAHLLSRRSMAKWGFFTRVRSSPRATEMRRDSGEFRPESGSLGSTRIRSGALAASIRGRDRRLWPRNWHQDQEHLSHTLRSARSHIFAPDLVMGYQSGYYFVSVFTGYRPRSTRDRSDSSRRSRDHPCRSSKIVHLFRKRDWFTLISCPAPPRCRPLSPRTPARASPSAPPAYP